MFKYFFVISFLTILSGCKKKDEIQTEIPATRNDTVKKVDAENIYEGIYTTNKHDATLLDCSNANSIYRVIDDSQKLEEQYNKMFEIPSVYNSIVVKVKGEVDSTTNPDIAEKYPMTLRINEVISTEKKNFRNTCVPYDFWALGNEPNWSLEISQKENLIEFLLPGEAKSYYFFYNDPVQENGYTVYRNHNPVQRYLIEIKIKKEQCSDTMSDRVYEYSATVELSDGRKFKGCAIKGKE